MKIRFEKIATVAKPFRRELDGVVLSGTMKRKGRHEVCLEGVLKGTVPMHCDRCGEAMDEVLEVPLTLRLSDIPIEHQEDLDIIEFLDGAVDIDYIIESEIGAMDGTFHFCETCASDETILEIEI